jgi:hypothetical protein
MARVKSRDVQLAVPSLVEDDQQASSVAVALLRHLHFHLTQHRGPQA